MTKQQCLLCGELAQQHQVKPMTYTYKSINFVINQPAQWCDACGEGVINSKDSAAVLPLIQSKQAQIDELLTPGGN